MASPTNRDFGKGCRSALAYSRVVNPSLSRPRANLSRSDPQSHAESSRSTALQMSDPRVEIYWRIAPGVATA